jgi:hypothetical protein
MRRIKSRAAGALAVANAGCNHNRVLAASKIKVIGRWQGYNGIQ